MSEKVQYLKTEDLVLKYPSNKSRELKLTKLQYLKQESY